MSTVPKQDMQGAVKHLNKLLSGHPYTDNADVGSAVGVFKLHDAGDEWEIRLSDIILYSRKKRGMGETPLQIKKYVLMQLSGYAEILTDICRGYECRKENTY